MRGLAKILTLDFKILGKTGINSDVALRQAQGHSTRPIYQAHKLKLALFYHGMVYHEREKRVEWWSCRESRPGPNDN